MDFKDIEEIEELRKAGLDLIEEQKSGSCENVFAGSASRGEVRLQSSYHGALILMSMCRDPKFREAVRIAESVMRSQELSGTDGAGC